MLRRLEANAAKLNLSLETGGHGAEELPFADNSFDTVVATLMLCSVDDPARSLEEVRRVLALGGELRFMEHVRAASRGWARFQDWVTPVWRRILAGCHPNRDTLSSIRETGFEVVELRTFNYGPHPSRPHIVGVARQPG